MLDNLNFRKFKQEDLCTILNIAIEAWIPVYQGYSEILGEEIFEIAFTNWEKRKKEDIKRTCTECDNCYVYVVETDNEIAGFLTLFIDPVTCVGTIGNNAVHPDYQGCGIGGKMYEFAFEQFKEHGMKCATVTTGGDNGHLPARKAYQKAGFSLHLDSLRYFCKL